MGVVLEHAPLEVYDYPVAGPWLRSRQGWDLGFENPLKPLADKGQLELFEGYWAALRASRLIGETNPDGRCARC